MQSGCSARYAAPNRQEHHPLRLLSHKCGQLHMPYDLLCNWWCYDRYKYMINRCLVSMPCDGNLTGCKAADLHAGGCCHAVSSCDARHAATHRQRSRPVRSFSHSMRSAAYAIWFTAQLMMLWPIRIHNQQVYSINALWLQFDWMQVCWPACWWVLPCS